MGKNRTVGVDLFAILFMLGGFHMIFDILSNGHMYFAIDNIIHSSVGGVLVLLGYGLSKRINFVRILLIFISLCVVAYTIHIAFFVTYPLGGVGPLVLIFLVPLSIFGLIISFYLILPKVKEQFKGSAT